MYNRLDYGLTTLGPNVCSFMELSRTVARPDSLSSRQRDLPNHTQATTDAETRVLGRGIYLPSSGYSFGGAWNGRLQSWYHARMVTSSIPVEQRGAFGTALRVPGNRESNAWTLAARAFPSSSFNSSRLRQHPSNLGVFSMPSIARVFNGDASYFTTRPRREPYVKLGYFWQSQFNDVLTGNRAL